MKHILTVLTLVLLATVCKAQSPVAASNEILTQNLAVAATSTHLELTWQTSNNAPANYWEVQGSADGKSFSTIGLVLGGKEGTAITTYNFRQTTKNIRPGFKYYRVLHIASETNAIASSVVSLSK